MKFLFDLDGTITKIETLPLIAKHFNVEDCIKELTAETIKGNIPFVESFIKRVNLLKQFPISEIADLLAAVPLYLEIVKFINSRPSECAIVTGNYAGWIAKLASNLKCECFSSEGIVENDRLIKLTKILKKEEVVKHFQKNGECVVFVGDGNNDSEAIRAADIGIGCGLTHYPAKSVVSYCDYLIFDEATLVRQLNQIVNIQSGSSLVLSCAGVGSRLGLGSTKVLINFADEPLINLHLRNFESFTDLRIVVGFQASELIEHVLSIRKDVIFVFNHDYFNTKTGKSYYLGAKHAREYVIEWDGDLVLHPNDIELFKNPNSEFICGTKILSDDPVLMSVKNESVISFSTQLGDWEWTGPCCVKRVNISDTSENVYNQLELLLPLPFLLIRARDFDTYQDYTETLLEYKSWSTGI